MSGSLGDYEDPAVALELECGQRAARVLVGGPGAGKTFAVEGWGRRQLVAMAMAIANAPVEGEAARLLTRTTQLWRHGGADVRVAGNHPSRRRSLHARPWP